MESDPSAAAVADGDLLPFDNDRHLALPAGGFQHGFHVLGRGFHIDVIVIPVGLTGLLSVRSSGLTEDANRGGHGQTPFF